MRNFQEQTLDFYRLVSIRVKAPAKAAAFLKTEWKRFIASGDGSRADISVRWERTIPPERRQRGPGTKHLGGWYKGCFWRAVVAEDGGPIEVDYSCMPPSGFLFKDACLEPLLLAVLESKGVHAIHASSVALGHRAWGFCGRSGSGKTILALLAANEGHTLLSDDITIVGDGKVYPYCVPPRIYLHDYLDRDLFNEISQTGMPANFIRNLMIDIATLGQVRIPSPLVFGDRSDPFPSQIRECPLGGLFFIRNGSANSDIAPMTDRAQVLHEIVQNSPIHGGAMIGALDIGKTMNIARVRGLEAEVGRLVDAGRCFTIRLRPEMSMGEWKSLVSEAVAVAEGFD